MKYKSRGKHLLSLVSAGMLLFGMARGDVVDRISVMSEKANSGFVQEALEQRVYHIIRTQVGQDLSPKVLNDDLKELMSSGSFDNVRIEHVQLGEGHVGLNIFVVPKPAVRAILFRGNQEYSESKLTDIVEASLKIGTPAEERNKAAARKAILKKYGDGGYYGTEVTTLEEKPADGQGVNVVFVIKEEPRYKLEGVYFKNGSVFTESELRTGIMTQRQWWRYIFRFGNYYNPLMIPMDKDALKKMYHNRGYLDFEVVDVNQELIEDNTWTKITYVLQEGEPYRISQISIVGNQKYSEDELKKLTKSKSGDLYTVDNDKYDTSAIKSKYAVEGYIDIHVWTVMKKDAEKHEVALEYHVNEGDVCTIRDIKIVGNDQTREDVIRRELQILPEDPGNPDLIEISRQRLMNLGYFSQVDILPAVTERSDRRDLRINVVEKPTGSVSLGAAFSTEDSAIGSFEFTETNFDLQKLLNGEWPPKGGGQRFRTRVAVGSKTTNVIVSLEEPWFLDERLSLHTELFWRERYEDEYDQRNIGGEVMLSWPIAFKVPFTDWVERNWRMGIGSRLEYVRISDVDTYDELNFDWDRAEKDCVRDHVIADEEDSYWANRLIWRLTRDTRDRFRFPTSGSILEFQTEYVTKALGSYEDYFRFSISQNKYYQVFGNRILKLGAGVATATGDDDVAIFDRYFAGGVGTIRGFKRRDVSPYDRHDDPLGGNTSLTGTVEFLQPVKDFMYASVFMDGGSVWWDSFDMDLDDLCLSTGVGVQFKALPISMYYGYPLVKGYDKLDGRGGRFHFSIGFTY